MPYQPPELLSDETQIALSILDGMRARIDGWDAAEGSVETVEAESIGIALGSAVAEFEAVLENCARSFGERVLRVVRREPVAATAVTTWTFEPGAGFTLDAGAEIDLTLPSGDLQTFITQTPIVVPASTSPHVVPAVDVISIEPGAENNHATNAATGAAICNIVGVTSVVVTSQAFGGDDGDTPEEYLDRVVATARRRIELPVTVRDYAAHACDDPRVDRCVAINRRDPSTSGDQPGHLTLRPVGPTGANLTTTDQASLAANLTNTDHVLGVTVHVEDMPRVNITVAVTVQAASDAPADLADQIKAAISAHLHPTRFDRDNEEPGGFVASGARTTEVTVFGISAAIDDIPGIQQVRAVALNGAATPVTLPGPWSLPNLTAPATVTIT